MADERGNHNRQVRRATIVASSVAFFLVIFKIIVGLFTGSVMLIASAVDSGLDFLVSLFNYFAVRNAEKPSDETYNYGRGKIKALASVIEGCVIVVSSLFIVYAAAIKILEHSPVHETGAALLTMVVALTERAPPPKFCNKPKSAAMSQDVPLLKTDAFRK